jgi:RNA polymerase sigma factor (sigma-70 family)
MSAYAITAADPISRPAFAPPSSTGVLALRRKETPAVGSILTELITRITHKDEAALAALHDISIGRVFGLAFRITRQREAAEEVAADVYMQAWDQAERFDALRGSVLSWLLTICRSRALDHVRWRDHSEPHPEPETLAGAPDAFDDDPQDLLLAVESSGRMHAALQELDGVQRQLLGLAFFKGLSHREIAEHAGLPLGTVKSHLRRALQAMRTSLDDECTGVA